MLLDTFSVLAGEGCGLLASQFNVAEDPSKNPFDIFAKLLYGIPLDEQSGNSAGNYGPRTEKQKNPFDREKTLGEKAAADRPTEAMKRAQEKEEALRRTGGSTPNPTSTMPKVSAPTTPTPTPTRASTPTMSAPTPGRR